MILISHRGNINGRITEYENKPEYIEDTIRLGFDVEIDVWVVGGTLLLGHDEPQYPIDIHWLENLSNKLWIHCKNIEAMEWFNMIGGFNYFWHEEDTMTFTSNGYMWVYPGKQPVKNSIAVMPEICSDDISECKGVCSDYIKKYKKI